MLWLLVLTLPSLGGSVPVTSDPSPGTELVGIIRGHAAADGAWPWQGDSGGPLVCSWEGIWVQVGIVSWGYSCGHRDFPGVYARVMSYISWIRKYVPLCPGS
ncbi:Mastin [Myotis davidii]|uniref:Mastin n=1 Tax=Myotis davidii TaxID=225400 RepID=L5M494_MYODS|nr:Mastin [Myotis davidii]